MEWVFAHTYDVRMQNSKVSILACKALPAVANALIIVDGLTHCSISEDLDPQNAPLSPRAQGQTLIAAKPRAKPKVEKGKTSKALAVVTRGHVDMARKVMWLKLLHLSGM